ncbi:heterokaryon incompatibility protein-domain-containing protein [Chaetomium strumarium]|uniref:Heterokaryon incompatibility protein-domain-containing protein n=1 Tax=Chaetomium strumarium TaxID=1170767 RepID=A0AAJ0GRY5_9PEZI|nr:heterokaryon incompatibility protein-domain-containing protein [Chaetomium strumarium]
MVPVYDHESVRRWLDVCAAKHEGCPGNDWVKLPTTLVEVSPPGSPESACLRFTDGQEGRYATFSYCWGGPQPFDTVAASLAAYSRELPYTRLPKTILDAFQVTRCRGLRYIWIDSLCIVQDDPDDKQRELPKMFRIYGNSFITISRPVLEAVMTGF